MTRYRLALARFSNRRFQVRKGALGTLIPFTAVTSIAGAEPKEEGPTQIVITYAREKDKKGEGRWHLEFATFEDAAWVVKGVVTGLYRANIGCQRAEVVLLALTQRWREKLERRRNRIYLPYDGLAYAYPAFAAGYLKDWVPEAVAVANDLLFRFPLADPEGNEQSPLGPDVQFSLGKVKSLNRTTLASAGLPIIKALAHNSWFKTLRIRGNCSYPRALWVAAGIMKHNTTLRGLDIASPPGVSKSRVLILFRSMICNPGCSLTVLTLTHVPLSSLMAQAALALAAAPHVRTLQLDHNGLRDEDFVAFFSTASSHTPPLFSTLSNLMIANNGVAGVEGSRAFARWLLSPHVNALTTLVLDGTTVAEYALLSSLTEPDAPPLQILSRARCSLTSPVLAALVTLLRKSPSLTALNLSSPKVVDSETLSSFISIIADISRPLSLGLGGGIKLSSWEPCIHSMVQAGSTLHSLVLDDAVMTHREFRYLCQSLRDFTSLSSLSLCRIVRSSSKWQKRVPELMMVLASSLGALSLRALFLSGNKAKKACLNSAGFEALFLNTRAFTSLSVLHVDGNNATEVGIEYLVRIIYASQTLTCLEIDGNALDLGGLESLACAVVRSPSLLFCEVPHANLKLLRGAKNVSGADLLRLDAVEHAFRSAPKSKRLFPHPSPDEETDETDETHGEEHSGAVEGDGSLAIFHRPVGPQLLGFDRLDTDGEDESGITQQLSQDSLKSIEGSIPNDVGQPGGQSRRADRVLAMSRLRDSVLLPNTSREANLFRLLGDGRRPMSAITLAGVESVVSHPLDDAFVAREAPLFYNTVDATELLATESDDESLECGFPGGGATLRRHVRHQIFSSSSGSDIGGVSDSCEMSDDADNENDDDDDVLTRVGTSSDDEAPIGVRTLRRRPPTAVFSYHFSMSSATTTSSDDDEDDEDDGDDVGKDVDDPRVAYLVSLGLDAGILDPIARRHPDLSVGGILDLFLSAVADPVAEPVHVADPSDSFDSSAPSSPSIAAASIAAASNRVVVPSFSCGSESSDPCSDPCSDPDIDDDLPSPLPIPSHLPPNTSHATHATPAVASSDASLSTLLAMFDSLRTE